MLTFLLAAARAIQEMNYIPLNGKPVRIMYSHRDPSVRRSGAGNIFIKVFFCLCFFNIPPIAILFQQRFCPFCSVIFIELGY